MPVNHMYPCTGSAAGRRNQSEAMVLHLFIFSILTVIIPIGVAANEIDWSGIEALHTTAFYPGVASWEFLRGEDHGKGAVPVRAMKKTCADCHVGKNGKYYINADRIITGEQKKSISKVPFEPQPVPDASGFKNISIKAAHDAENIYLRFQWPGAAPIQSSDREDAAARSQFSSINVQLGNKIGSFRKFGCFITCHDNQTGMPEAGGEHIRLYAYYTRSGGNKKPQNVLDQYLANGQFIDLWRINYVQGMVNTEDFHILHDRLHDKNDLVAEGNYTNGIFTVVVTRRLSTGDVGDIRLGVEETFTIGISIHENLNRGRRHYTTFPISVGISAPADITAERL